MIQVHVRVLETHTDVYVRAASPEQAIEKAKAVMAGKLPGRLLRWAEYVI